MLLNDECSSWYKRVGDFLVSVWNRRKEILYSNGSACRTQQSNPTPECVVNSTECRLSASDLFIYLFIYVHRG